MLEKFKCGILSFEIIPDALCCDPAIVLKWRKRIVFFVSVLHDMIFIYSYNVEYCITSI